MLIIRFDDLEEHAGDAIEQFFRIEITNKEFPHENAGTLTSPLYGTHKIKLSKEYVNAMYDPLLVPYFMPMFWTPHEIEELKAKWLNQ